MRHGGGRRRRASAAMYQRHGDSGSGMDARMRGDIDGLDGSGRRGKGGEGRKHPPATSKAARRLVHVPDEVDAEQAELAAAIEDEAHPNFELPPHIEGLFVGRRGARTLLKRASMNVIINVITLSQLKRIEPLDGANYVEWKNNMLLNLGPLENDLALREDPPVKPKLANYMDENDE
uniref:Uncharacterized protein n=1 Tax=Oryza brachyantha TaxID=4533 RepID=J3N0V8_ORYBR